MKLWPIIRFQLDQFLLECSIFVVLIACIRSPCNRGVAVVSHVGPYNFPCFQEGYISLVFHLKYSLFFFVNIANLALAGWSCRQFTHLISFLQSSSMWSGSFSPHLAHVYRPLLASLWCPYLWHLKHFKGAGTYRSTLSRQ